MTRFKKILLPTDFSDCANAALSHAEALAERFQGAVHILHALTLHGGDPAKAEEAFSGTPISYEGIVNSAEEMLHTKEGMVKMPVLIERVLIRGFSAAEEIIRYAEAEEVDAIVMGTHGRTGIQRFVAGSVAEKVVRYAACPVMTVRSEISKPDEYVSYRSVLVPTDFSDASTEALWTAAEIAGHYGAILTALHIVEPPGYNEYLPDEEVESDEALKKRTDDAESALARFLNKAPLEGITVYRRVEMGKPAVRIVEFAEEEEIDLIVIASRGLTGLKRLRMGSTTGKVIPHAKCPVLTVKRL